MLGGRFVHPMKQPGTEDEGYKARFTVQGEKVKEKTFIIHISKKIRQKNVKILISISATYDLRVWNQYVNQAYIHPHNL